MPERARPSGASIRTTGIVALIVLVVALGFIVWTTSEDAASRDRQFNEYVRQENREDRCRDRQVGDVLYWVGASFAAPPAPNPVRDDAARNLINSALAIREHPCS